MNKWLLGVFLMASPCAAETITVTLPPDQYHRLATEACEHPIWKFRAAPEACMKSDDAVLLYMMEKIITTGSMGQLKGMADLSMTVEIVHAPPRPEPD